MIVNLSQSKKYLELNNKNWHLKSVTSCLTYASDWNSKNWAFVYWSFCSHLAAKPAKYQNSQFPTFTTKLCNGPAPLTLVHGPARHLCPWKRLFQVPMCPLPRHTEGTTVEQLSSGNLPCCLLMKPLQNSLQYLLRFWRFSQIPCYTRSWSVYIEKFPFQKNDVVVSQEIYCACFFCKRLVSSALPDINAKACSLYCHSNQQTAPLSTSPSASAW